MTTGYAMDRIQLAVRNVKRIADRSQHICGFVGGDSCWFRVALRSRVVRTAHRKRRQEAITNDGAENELSC